mgnify:CR=1 FL=1
MSTLSTVDKSTKLVFSLYLLGKTIAKKENSTSKSVLLTMLYECLYECTYLLIRQKRLQCSRIHFKKKKLNLDY